MKFAIPQFFNFFGHNCANNLGLTVAGNVVIKIGGDTTNFCQ